MTYTASIDGWVNVTLGDGEPPEWLVRVKEDYLKGGDDFFRSLEPDELLDVMDGLNVRRAIVSHDPRAGNDRPLRFTARDPERFSLAVSVDPHGLMPALWELEALARSEPVACARVVPFMSDTPPSDAVYYPLYAKCVELDLPLTINAGLPGPPIPGECQHPIHLDRVCYRFPELRLAMAHGADPWWGVAIRLMIKYANLQLMTSAYAPKRFPPELVHFMNTRGQDKILFASDHPALPLERCVREAHALDLREGVLEKFMRTNAERFFFAARSPRY